MPQILQDLHTGLGQIEFELDQDEYAAIGRVMVQWAYLEQGIYEMSVGVADAFGIETPKDARHKSFSKRARTLRDLVGSYLDDRLRERFEGLLDTAALLADQRNQVAHGTWEWDLKDPDLLTARCLRPSSDFEKNYRCDQIHELADKIGRLSFDFQYEGGWEEAFIDTITNGNPETKNISYCSVQRHHARLKRQRTP